VHSSHIVPVIAKNQEVDQNEILGSKVRIVEELANGEPAFGKVDDGDVFFFIFRRDEELLLADVTKLSFSFIFFSP
jgi:hypothetical protein